MAVPDTEGKKKKGPAREGCCFRACLTPTLEKGQPMMPGGSPEGGWGGGRKTGQQRLLGRDPESIS